MTDGEFISLFNLEQRVLPLSEYESKYFNPYNHYDRYEKALSIDCHFLKRSCCKELNVIILVLINLILQLHKNRTELSVCFYNIWSIPCNLDVFCTELELHECNFDVICFAETRLGKDKERLHKIPNYNIISNSRNRRGVEVYVFT